MRETWKDTNRLIEWFLNRKKPATWEGYRPPEYLLPQEPLKEVKKEGIKTENEVEESGKETKEAVDMGTLDSLDTITISADKDASKIAENVSSTPKTPVNKRKEEKEELQQSPGGLSFYPTIGGVLYRPINNEATYKPVYERHAKSMIANKELEKESVKNQRELSVISASTGEKNENSTLGSLGAIGGSTLNTLDVI